MSNSRAEFLRILLRRAHRADFFRNFFARRVQTEMLAAHDLRKSRAFRCGLRAAISRAEKSLVFPSDFAIRAARRARATARLALFRAPRAARRAARDRARHRVFPDENAKICLHNPENCLL
jgi:hypothetical protein